MAQVLPAFYDSFTRGRKDELDFQGIIEAQRQAKLMNPLLLEQQGNQNRLTYGYGTQMEQRNREYGLTSPDRVEATNTGNQAQTGANRMGINYYGATQNEYDEAGQRIQDPTKRNAAQRMIAGVGMHPAVYAAGQMQPQAQFNPGDSGLDAWIRAQGYTKVGEQTGSGDPVQGRTGAAPNASPQIPEEFYRTYGSPQGELTKDRISQTVNDFNTPNYPVQIPQEFNPQVAVQKIIAAGMDPIVAQRMVDADIARGLPLGTTAAIGMAESNFNPNAVSPAGAQGLMQIMPENFDMYGGPMFDPQNAQQSVGVAEKLIAERQKIFPEYNIDQLLRSYNGRMDLDESRMGPDKLTENREYPQRVRDAYNRLYGFVGF